MLSSFDSVNVIVNKTVSMYKNYKETEELIAHVYCQGIVSPLDKVRNIFLLDAYNPL